MPPWHAHVQARTTSRRAAEVGDPAQGRERGAVRKEEEPPPPDDGDGNGDDDDDHHRDDNTPDLIVISAIYFKEGALGLARLAQTTENGSRG